MPEHLLSLAAPLLAAVLLIFLMVRLRLFSEAESGGRYLIVTGGLLIFVAFVWQFLSTLNDYPNWFVPSAYLVVNLAQLALVISGFVMIAVGLGRFSDGWQARRVQIDERESKASIMDNLQKDARQPYQLLDLLNIAIREFLYHLPECGGAIFLLNRSQRRLVLASSAGLSVPETASLEHYPLGKNMISQAIELGDPLIGNGFDLIETDGRTVPSRFSSCLVLPMVSGRERIGAVLLLSPESRIFGETEIKYLLPVVAWLAEKIYATRLGRELSLARSEADSRKSEQAATADRIALASESMLSADATNEFCRSLVGLAGAESAYLVGLKQGSLAVHGGNQPLDGLSESFRTALIDAIHQTKPLIINQEATNDSGVSETILSSLIIPLDRPSGNDALLLRRGSSVFKVDERQMKTLTTIGRLGCMVLKQDETQRSKITRRKGLEAILKLLQFEPDAVGFDDDPGYFVRQLASALPASALAITFRMEGKGALRVVESYRIDKAIFSEFYVLPAEGELGLAAAGDECVYMTGRSRIGAVLDAYSTRNRTALQRLTGQSGIPSFVALCPVSNLADIRGIVAILFYDIVDSDRVEWEHFLTLATRLYSLRLGMIHLQAQAERAQELDPVARASGQVTNELNNHLSAVLGKAELVSRRTDVPGDIRGQLQEIIDEAAKAAKIVRGLQTRPLTVTEQSSAEREEDSLDVCIASALDDRHISANLYMTGGRPHEVSLSLDAPVSIDLPGSVLSGLIGTALDKFGSWAETNDIISIATYREGSNAFFDFSRHHRDFPPVKRVALFGEYLAASEALRLRPSDDYLRQAPGESVYYAADRQSESPFFISFRFETSPQGKGSPNTQPRTPARILAIDDQPVILDLIVAMGQSLGYEVTTASNGESGVRLAERQTYDIILTDLSMPGISGLEVARRIRANHPETPIILITGWEANLDRQQLSSVGITDVLYKPFRMEQLIDLFQSSVS